MRRMRPPWRHAACVALTSAIAVADALFAAPPRAPREYVANTVAQAGHKVQQPLPADHDADSSSSQTTARKAKARKAAAVAHQDPARRAAPQTQASQHDGMAVAADDRNGMPILGSSGIQERNGRFVLARQPLAQPLETTQPIEATAPMAIGQPLETFNPGGALGETTGSFLTSAEIRAIVTANPAAGTANLNPVTTAAAPDLGQSLAENIRSVQTQRRSPVAQAPYIRAFKAGQLYTQLDGAYWVPARQDLDTILSKIDAGSVEDVVVIAGPYSVLYGPGFSFIDIVTLPTPRNQPLEFRTSGSYINNGRQWYGREVVSGGTDVFGFRMSYGHRTGSDYRSGDSTLIPSSYNNRDVFADFGYSLNPDQRIEFNYRRIDQTNTEYPAQVFDIDDLVSDGFNLRLIDTDPTGPWSRMVVGGWYNRTRFNGDSLAGAKGSQVVPNAFTNPAHNVVNRIEGALARADGLANPTDVRFVGFTDADILSTGGRVAMTFGDLDDINLTTGGDFRYLSQSINERFLIFAPAGSSLPPEIQTNLPRSSLANPGLFSELALPMTTYWTARLGTRIDWVHTNVRRGELRGFNPGIGPMTGSYNGSLPGVGADLDILSQNDTMFGGYLTNDIQLTDTLGVSGGFGYAQRPPTLIDRYADAVFLGIIQSGFSRVIGRPDLDREQNLQVDVGMTVNFENARGYVRGFHAWVLDYITYSVARVDDPTGARLLSTVNTRYATLRGCEASSELDLTGWLSPFVTMTYVNGIDQEIDRPLPSIPPLQSRMGIRIHDLEGGRRWGLEFAARPVAPQNLIGTVRTTGAEDDRTLDQTIEFPTAGFTTWHLRGYWNPRRNLHLVSGIDNLFDKNYIEHLSLRLPADANGPVVIPPTLVLSPGFTPYFNLEWIY